MDEEYYAADEDFDGWTRKEVCDSCGRLMVCEHLDGLGRSRLLCKECLENVFGAE